MKRLSTLFVIVIATACGDDSSPSTPSPADGGVDSGNVPSDAGAEAAIDAGPTFCTTQTADFCADFDRGVTPGAGWTGVAVAGGGTVALEAATETSKPNVLKATMPALDGSVPNLAYAQVAKQDIALGGKKKI